MGPLKVRRLAFAPERRHMNLQAAISFDVAKAKEKGKNDLVILMYDLFVKSLHKIQRLSIHSLKFEIVIK
jgi:hypothetical protein